MKTLITYKTYLGSSGKYAQWIAEKTKSDMVVFSRAKNNLLSEYDTIVVISGTYAGHMPLLRFLKKHWKVLSEKKVVAVAVGAAPTTDPWSVKSYEAIPENIKQAIEYFKLPSSIEKKGRESLKKSSVTPIIDYLKKLK
jgi:menaquinone-dependent protoporphyrinogen IX oxidase